MFLLLVVVTFSCVCQTLIDTLELFDLTFALPIWNTAFNLLNCLSACWLLALSFRTLFLIISLSVMGGLSSVQHMTHQWWGQLHPCCILWNYTFKIAQSLFFSSCQTYSIHHRYPFWWVWIWRMPIFWIRSRFLTALLSRICTESERNWICLAFET